MGKRLLLLATILALGAACADDPKRPPIADDLGDQPARGGNAGGGGGTADGGGTTGADAGGGDAGACTDLLVTGATIDMLAVTGDPPAGTGGAIGDGTYDITDARYYAGPAGVPGVTGNSYQGTIRITGQSYERALVLRTSNAATSQTHGRGTFIPSAINGNATISLTCPGPSQEQVTYSVNGDSLTVSDLISKTSFTYKKKL